MRAPETVESLTDKANDRLDTLRKCADGNVTRSGVEHDITMVQAQIDDLRDLGPEGVAAAKDIDERLQALIKQFS